MTHYKSNALVAGILSILTSSMALAESEIRFPSDLRREREERYQAQQERAELTWKKRMLAQEQAEKARREAAARLNAERKKVLDNTELISVPENTEEVNVKALRYVQTIVEINCKVNNQRTTSTSTAGRTSSHCSISPTLMILEAFDGKVHRIQAKYTEVGGLVLDLGNKSILIGRLNHSEIEKIEEARRNLDHNSSEIESKQNHFKNSGVVVLAPELFPDFVIENGSIKRTYFSRKLTWAGTKLTQSIDTKKQEFNVWKYTANGQTITKEIQLPIQKNPNSNSGRYSRHRGSFNWLFGN